MRTLRQALQEERARVGDWTAILRMTPTDERLDHPDGYLALGPGEGFVAWSETRVYFMMSVEGGFWVESVPRDPSDEVVLPKGGG